MTSTRIIYKLTLNRDTDRFLALLKKYLRNLIIHHHFVNNNKIKFKYINQIKPWFEKSLEMLGARLEHSGATIK